MKNKNRRKIDSYLLHLETLHMLKQTKEDQNVSLTNSYFSNFCKPYCLNKHPE